MSNTRQAKEWLTYIINPRTEKSFARRLLIQTTVSAHTYHLFFDYAAQVGARRASCYCWPSLFPQAECRSDGLRGTGSCAIGARVMEELGQVQAAVTDLVLQGGGKLIDVSGGNVYRRAIFEK
jgi:hypothetical protein